MYIIGTCRKELEMAFLMFHNIHLIWNYQQKRTHHNLLAVIEVTLMECNELAPIPTYDLKFLATEFSSSKNILNYTFQCKTLI